jgi:hypothetical protein
VALRSSPKTDASSPAQSSAVAIPGATLDLSALVSSITSLAESTKRLQENQIQQHLQHTQDQRRMQDQLDALTELLKK